MTAATGTRTWTLSIPAPDRMFSENSSEHWRVTTKSARAWREASFLWATEAKLPKHLGRVRVDVALHFGDGRDRDAYNYHRWVAKPIVDGLARPRAVKGRRGMRVEPGYQLVDDDNTRYMDGPFITIGAPVSRKVFRYGLAVVTITDLNEATLPREQPVAAVPEPKPVRRCECGTTYRGSGDVCGACRRRRAIVNSLLDENRAGEAAEQLRRDRAAVFSFITASMIGTGRSPSIASITRHINAVRAGEKITEHRVRSVVDTLTADRYLDFTDRKFTILKPLGAAA